jgi:nitrite reductase/ring-hydroxylating ferredoxin subunit
VSDARNPVGSLSKLQADGQLLTKAGAHGVCVFWHEGCAYAVDDRCPHMGFPLHRGTVEHGLLTCHWHNARFDLATGDTLDPFADDVRAYPVEIDGDDVFLVVEPEPDRVAHLHHRLAEGLEQGLTLVTAKAVLGLLEAGVPSADIVRSGVDYGTAYRAQGWGAGLTVLVAMANLLPHLAVDDHALALVHGLSFVSRDTRNRPPRFPLAPLGGDSEREAPPGDRLASWYRRFIDTRSADAAERTLATAIVAGVPEADVHDMMTAAATDHVFLDEGHTLDFTNKAFEAVGLLGWPAAARVLPTLVAQTAAAHRHEEDGLWRHPHDLVSLLAQTTLDYREAPADGFDDDATAALAWALLGDEPEHVVAALVEAATGGASAEQLGRAVALAAGLRITRFHIQNDHADWNVVHHAFTHANALHQRLAAHPAPELLRGVVAGALRVYLDRFLNIPAARLPQASPRAVEELETCWDNQGHVDRAGEIAYGHLATGGDPAELIAALGHALLAEDAEFHWIQTVEAAVRQFQSWPPGSEEGALLLAGTARFLAAHTPTRRELPQVVRIATRLRRGEELFEED